MSWDLYLAYILALTVFLAIPGPTIMIVVSYALARGRRAAWATILGVALGDVIAMILSFAGLGAVLAASATAFVWLKWVGAAYLVWLGIKMWRADPKLAADDGGLRAASDRRAFVHCTMVTALNPKTIVFFLAFLPQFINPAAPAVPQLALLGATFMVLATGIVWLYALTAATARERITSPRLLSVVNKTGGTLLIGAGAVTAAMRRAG